MTVSDDAPAGIRTGGKVLRNRETARVRSLRSVHEQRRVQNDTTRQYEQRRPTGLKRMFHAQPIKKRDGSSTCTDHSERAIHNFVIGNHYELVLRMGVSDKLYVGFLESHAI